MKKIAIFEFIDFYHGPPNGIHKLIRSMVKYSSQIDWIIFDKAGTFEKSNPLVGEPVFQFMNQKKNRLRIRIPDSLRFVLRYMFYSEKVKPDIIHAHRVELGLFAILFFPKVPLILFIHNAAQDLRSFRKSSSFWRFIPFIHALITKIVYKRAFKIITFSRVEYKEALRLSNSVSLAQTFYDDEIFYPNKLVISQIKSELSKSIKIAWVGRLEREKNPELALEIAKNLIEMNVDINLEMIGYGSLLTTLQKFIKINNMEKSIRLHGRLEPLLVGHILRQSDLLLQTSKYEGSPTALIEALASGICVVTTNSGDPDKIIIDGENGYVVNSFESVDFLLPILQTSNIMRNEIAKSVARRSKNQLINKLLLIAQ